MIVPHQPKIIAEIGCNHKGELSIAKDLIRSAAEYCKVDVVKFQKRHSKELLSLDDYAKPHPNPQHAYGLTYGEHRDFLEFSIEEHKELKEFAEALGVVYSTSVWDIASAKEVIQLNPEFIKIPSALNLHFNLLSYLCENYSCDIHISTGMTTKSETEQIISFFESRDAAKRVVLYNCTSGYPVPFEDICLLDITYLIHTYGHRIKEIGFSGHHLGIAVDVAAITLGAKWVERHFTLDRTWKGTDHAASLEPDGMRKLVRDLTNVSKALTRKQTDILPIEEIQRDKLKWKNHA